MATPEGHLIMCDWYYARSKSDFQTAKSSDKLEDKVGYFASSAEFLLASVDHLLGWFTRSNEFTGRIGRRNAFMCHKNIRKLGQDKKNNFLRLFDEVETVRNKIFYLHSTDLKEVEFISISKLNPLLKRYKNVYSTIKQLR
ncbi:MAG: hypothetical protein ACE5J3_07150 [Methanosarcinales archaeon]